MLNPEMWIIPTPPTNNEDTASQAAAASNCIPDIPTDPLQPSKIRLHSWQLFNPQAQGPQLQGQNISSDLNLRDAFH